MSRRSCEDLTVESPENISSGTSLKRAIDSIGDTGVINCSIVSFSLAQLGNQLLGRNFWLQIWRRIRSYVNRHKIKSEGYKTQDSLNDPLFGGRGVVENEISVNIDRKGRFLFYDGRHRLSIVLVLGLEEIPVKVCVRHTEWQKFVNELMDYAKKQPDGELYQPLTHPDLQNIPFKHGHKRFELIKDNLEDFNGDLLDIGANTGYFSSRFEELGYNCFAVEYNRRLANFLEKLKAAEERDFEVINKSIFDYGDKKDFDVVLALNIFHHFIKNKNDHDALINFLEELDMETMFFEPHLTDGGPVPGVYRNYEPDEFAQFVKEHASLNNSELIGIADDGRPLYKLWK